MKSTKSIFLDMLTRGIIMARGSYYIDDELIEFMLWEREQELKLKCSSELVKLAVFLADKDELTASKIEIILKMRR